MTTELDVLRTGYDRTLALVDGLEPQDLTRTTPCGDWDVRALLVHVVAGTDGLVALLRGEQPDWSRDALGDDPALAVRHSVGSALAAWAEPGAVDRPSQQMPGMRVVDFAMADAVVHAWDLGAALGRPWEPDPDVVRLVHERWAGEPAEKGSEWGAFGPRVDVPDGAPPLDALVALLGRDPSFAGE